jgi:TonB family protein
MCGVGVLLARLAWQLTTIVRMTRSAELSADKVFRLKDSTCPFSFFRWIFVNPQAQSEEQLQEIMTHERAHVEQWHSLDIVLMELLAIACWPNPFVWLMRREVRLNLEYLADERVVEAGSERKAYQYHLLGLAYGKNVATVCNNFNVLPLKLRIRMMNKKRTNSWLRAKYLLLVPVIGVALVACNLDKKTAEPATAAEQAQADSAAEKPLMVGVAVDGTPAQDEAQAEGSVVQGDVFDVVEKMPEFPGGQQELMNFLMKNIKYPKEATDKGTQGRVVVQFVVNKDGSVVEPTVVKSVSPELDQEALRVVKMMPKWQPGKQNGEVVRVKYTIPVSFRLQ